MTMTQRRVADARQDLLSLLAVIILVSHLHLASSKTAPCFFATAFQIQASVCVPQQQQQSSTTHHNNDIIKIESLVKEKLDRIATSYQTIHGEKLRRTCDVELELCQKIEKCFMGGANNNAIEEECTQSLLLSTKLKEKKSRLEECLVVNDRVVRQLLATSTPSEGGQSSSSLFDHVDFITSAAVAAGSTVGEYDDLGQLMGNGGLVQGGESNKETDGYDSALQVIHHTARDWTLGAAPCREETIMWIVLAIVQYYTQDRRIHVHGHNDDQLRVLIPGAGLGRLAYEVSTCRELIENGVVPHVEANDSSVTMIFAARNVIKMLQQQQQQGGRSHHLNSAIHPFLSDPQVNEIDARKRFEMEVFPDQPAIDSYKYYHDLTGTNPNLSFTIGDFVSTYSQRSKRNQYDVVATSFFIDTATNIYEYIYIIKHMLDDTNGGIWVNCGPVQWHPCALLRPTVEQLKDMLQVAGFELISWSIADEAVAYRHPEDVGGTGLEARYTRSEAYRPLRFVARLMTSQNDGDDDGNGSEDDLALKIQYSEFLNEVANGKIEVV